MARIKCLKDEYGVIREAAKVLPTEALKLAFLDALAELEDNDCYVRKVFPKPRLHRVTGIKQAIFRADIDKISGWRLHVQLGKDACVHIKDLVEGQKHDDVIQVIKAKQNRYE
jgi:hypothetical protein